MAGTIIYVKEKHVKFLSSLGMTTAKAIDRLLSYAEEHREILDKK